MRFCKINKRYIRIFILYFLFFQLISVNINKSIYIFVLFYYTNMKIEITFKRTIFDWLIILKNI